MRLTVYFADRVCVRGVGGVCGERERERMTTVQACLVYKPLLQIFAAEGYIYQGQADRAGLDKALKRFPIQNMLGLCYTFST